jgi:hypothetical protein
MAKQSISLVGRTFGRLQVVSEADRIGRKYRFWQCRCACGETSVVRHDGLMRGDYMSCGCFRIERVRAASTTHGMSQSSERTIWKGMHRRCRNEADPAFEHYGGRGIRVCERWQSFEAFLEDMGRRPSKAHTLERNDNDGPYSEQNCRWATMKEQSANKRSNVLLTFNGQTKAVAVWAEELGFHRDALYARLRYGWSHDRALSTPVRHRSRT